MILRWKISHVRTDAPNFPPCLIKKLTLFPSKSNLPTSSKGRRIGGATQNQTSTDSIQHPENPKIPKISILTKEKIDSRRN